MDVATPTTVYLASPMMPGQIPTKLQATKAHPSHANLKTLSKDKTNQAVFMVNGNKLINQW
jgi:hypothetical protein